MATATSEFGSGKRESHDATPFYERFGPPVISGDERVEAASVLDRLFHGDARDMTDEQVAVSLPLWYRIDTNGCARLRWTGRAQKGAL